MGERRKENNGGKLQEGKIAGEKRKKRRIHIRRDTVEKKKNRRN